jgi:hypothetical protein
MGVLAHALRSRWRGAISDDPLAQITPRLSGWSELPSM